MDSGFPANGDKLPVIDSALIPLSDLVDAMTGFDFGVADDWPEGAPDLHQILTVEEFTIDIPIEIEEHEDGDGHFALSCAPPTQQIETSTMPVFHRLRLRMTHAELE